MVIAMPAIRLYKYVVGITVLRAGQRSGIAVLESRQRDGNLGKDKPLHD